ncbi:hypothetical protein KA977_08800 [Candidatus Dependentiae bacterium]|nr:hypothetical protein [Candidatus Dependentiae bacterium]
MRIIIFVLLIFMVLFLTNCVKKPDNALEQLVSDTGTVSVSTYIIDSDGSINNTEDIIDTEAIRKKAREEFESQNQIMLQKYDERTSKEEEKNISDTLNLIENKGIGNIIKKKELIGKLDKKKSNE